jgi:hypothetical protein
MPSLRNIFIGDARDAYHYLGAGEVMGKIVIAME